MVLPVVIRGMIEASAMRRPSVIEFWTSKDENNGGNEFVTVVVRPELQEVLDALDRSKGGPSLRRATASRSPRRA